MTTLWIKRRPATFRTLGIAPHMRSLRSGRKVFECSKHGQYLQAVEVPRVYHSTDSRASAGDGRSSCSRDPPKGRRLRFRAEETEKCACWRPLRPGTLPGLAD